MQPAERVRELIDTICGRGWDGENSADVARAEACLATDGALFRDEFVLACATGEVEAVKERLEREPELATRPLGPRNWVPLAYVAYSLLARKHDGRAERITRVGTLLLERGADPNSGYRSEPGKDGKSYAFPVLYACIHVSDNLALAERLLEAGADPNDEQSLYHAAERFDLDALELLHRYGLEPGWLSYCMLHQIDVGFVPGVRWFLEHGADPNVMHPWGLSALHWAIQRPGNGKMVELLLAHGADSQQQTPDGLSPLDLAERRHGRTDVVAALERHGSLRGARTPLDELVVAAAYGDEARARSLLCAAPELLATLRDADRALVSAFAESGNCEGALILARLGFDLDAPSWMGMTALHWAACRGNPRLLLGLLDAGVPFRSAPGFGTPLHSAVKQRWTSFGYRPGESDYVGVVKVLLDAGYPIPDDLPPSGDADIDALIARRRSTAAGLAEHG